MAFGLGIVALMSFRPSIEVMNTYSGAIDSSDVDSMTLSFNYFVDSSDVDSLSMAFLNDSTEADSMAFAFLNDSTEADSVSIVFLSDSSGVDSLVASYLNTFAGDDTVKKDDGDCGKKTELLMTIRNFASDSTDVDSVAVI